MRSPRLFPRNSRQASRTCATPAQAGRLPRAGNAPQGVPCLAEDRCQEKITWATVFSFSPSSANWTPNPDCLIPPKAFDWMAPCLLIQTEPHSRRRPTALAASTSADQTEPPRPFWLSLARRRPHRSGHSGSPNCSSSTGASPFRPAMIVGEQARAGLAAQQDPAPAGGVGDEGRDLAVLHRFWTGPRMEDRRGRRRRGPFPHRRRGRRRPRRGGCRGHRAASSRRRSGRC